MAKPFIILGGAGLPWVYPLALELGKLNTTIAINLMASIPFIRNKSRWSYDDPERLTQRETWIYPPGFASKFKLIFRPLIKARLNRVMRYLYRKTGKRPYLITLYPWHYHYVLDVDSAHLIYLNYDDYFVNDDQKSKKENMLESRLIQRAGTILCSSISQTERFKKSFPERKTDIFHFPHGVHVPFINPMPEQAPEPGSVCIVGSLTARYDWELIYEVVTHLIEMTFIFVGNIGMGTHAGQKVDWERLLYKVLDLPNVKHIQGLKHSESSPYYWNSVINWMPYKADLVFVKAACPLKIPDGLASGRRVISSDVPECRLYPGWIKIYRDSAEAVAMIRNSLIAADFSKERQRAESQIEFARKNLWFCRAEQLIGILKRNAL